MKTILRNLLAIVVGFVVGSAVNMGLVTLGPMLIPPPDAVATAGNADLETLASLMHLFEPRHFIFPFLAHALGTLIGAVCAFFIAASRKVVISYAVALLFFLGGLLMVSQLPSPIWFILLDLGLAYFPMAALGLLIARRISA